MLVCFLDLESYFLTWSVGTITKLKRPPFKIKELWSMSNSKAQNKFAFNTGQYSLSFITFLSYPMCSKLFMFSLEAGKLTPTVSHVTLINIHWIEMYCWAWPVLSAKSVDDPDPLRCSKLNFQDCFQLFGRCLVFQVTNHTSYTKTLDNSPWRMAEGKISLSWP